MSPFDFPHRVTYAETDKMGYAYYANYLVWFEIGRTELIRASGLAYTELEEMGFYLPAMEVSCTYKKPVKYDDLITIRTAVSEFEGIRLGFTYEITIDGQVRAEGRTLHAFMDRDGRPKRLPADTRARLSEALSK